MLDIGIGAGRTTRFLAQRPVYVGFDIVGQMLRTARADLGENRLTVASANKLPFPAGTFDVAVLSFNGIGHVEQRGDVYSEVRRVLARGRFFIFSAYNARHIVSFPPKHPKAIIRWLRNFPDYVFSALLSRRLWFGAGYRDARLCHASRCTA